jgi:predicted negative regulator of RcsB-dependent stress response
MALDSQSTSDDYLENIKNKVIKYKNFVLAGFIIIAVAIFLNSYLKSSSLEKASKASEIFQKITLIKSKDTADLNDLANELKDKYAGTPYAARAQIILANKLTESGKFEDANATMLWAAEHAQEEFISQIAYYNLCLNYVTLKDTEQAKKYVAKISISSLQMLKNDLLGDIAVIEGKLEDAKKFYTDAIAASSNQSNFSKVIQYKLNNL